MMSVLRLVAAGARRGRQLLDVPPAHAVVGAVRGRSTSDRPGVRLQQSAHPPEAAGAVVAAGPPFRVEAGVLVTGLLRQVDVVARPGAAGEQLQVVGEDPADGVSHHEAGPRRTVAILSPPSQGSGARGRRS